MKKLRCDESGFRECNWEFLGETDDEVLRKAHEHDKLMHGRDVDEAQLRPHIHDV